jgi:hypothetical protein
VALVLPIDANDPSGSAFCCPIPMTMHPPDVKLRAKSLIASGRCAGVSAQSPARSTVVPLLASGSFGGASDDLARAHSSHATARVVATNATCRGLSKLSSNMPDSNSCAYLPRAARGPALATAHRMVFAAAARLPEAARPRHLPGVHEYEPLGLDP